jgi:hypothetical protein
MHDRAGLAGASSGEDEERAFSVEDRRALFRVQATQVTSSFFRLHRFQLTALPLLGQGLDDCRPREN